MSMNLGKLMGDEFHFSLEHRILNIVVLFGIIISLWLAVMTYLLHLGYLLVITCLISAAILAMLYYLSAVRKQYSPRVFVLLFISIIIITPALWILNGGILGGIPLYITIFSSIGATLQSGNRRVAVIAGLVIITNALLLLEYRYPSLITHSMDSTDKYIAVSTGLVITIVVNMLLFFLILDTYKKEHAKANYYFGQMEKQKMEIEMARLERLNLIGEMAASIGHEVRNPLTTIRGFLQLFQSRERDGNRAEIYDVMIKELDRANDIITEFLSLAKNKAVILKPCNLNVILKNLAPLITAAAMREDKLVQLELTDIPDIIADENEIRQLVLNLERNAREAVPTKGTVSISTGSDRETVVLSIRDSGGGIPPEIYRKLGTPFLTTKDKGTGLGLAVCYRIAERHNAKIEVVTGPAGTTFIIRFRAEKPA